MAKKYQTVNQDLKNISAYQMFAANMNFSVEQMVAKFKEDANKRHDLSDDFKKFLLSQPIGRDYEIVYYPVYFYNTTTDVSWQTTSTNSQGVYDSGYKLGTIKTTTTYSHSKTGIKGSSGLKVKKDHDELDVKKLDLKQTGMITNYRSLNIPVYESGLFFSESENGDNAVSAGRDAAKAKRNQSTYTRYQSQIVLVPIVRYAFEYQGKQCVFEMNLHNGEYVTAYKQKPAHAFVRVTSTIFCKLCFILAMILPIFLVVKGFVDKQAVNGNVINMILSFAGLIVAEIIALVCWAAFGNKRAFYYERATTMQSAMNFIGMFVAPIISFVIVALLANYCAGVFFI